MSDPTLYERLLEYGKTGRIPFHMPGHKRQPSFGGVLPYDMDITEIDGFDNLHAPTGILLDLCRRASRLWGSATSFPLVNGSTCGILAGIRTLTAPGDRILMARGCHQSVYHAVELCGLGTCYLPAQTEPKYGILLSVDPDEVDRMLTENPDVRLTVVTSPTYEGVCSDLRRISDVVHRHGGRLMVDQAHGAHLGLSPHFPESAMEQGADLVIASLHKTLPSMTQTAVAHLAKSVDSDPFARNLSIFETSSPSYVLLASVDRCLSLLEREKKALFDAYNDRLDEFKRATASLVHLKIPGYSMPLPAGVFDFDRGKICICTSGTDQSGFTIADLLRESHNIEPEMANEDYVLAMTSIADSTENFKRLADALLSIDAALADRPTKKPSCRYAVPEQILPIGETVHLAGEWVPLMDAIGRLSLDYVRAYPPGIPLIVPGEAVDRELVERISGLAASGATVLTGKGKFSGEIFVKAEKRD
ncbi:MAG: aminotransferase class I/II-fold pyridoxal phosphate-dependent enzyme [Eubacteriales bacterium]